MKLTIILLFTLFLTGCAATSPATKQPHAECLVCKKNADLACVDVEVDANTPTAAYNGQTYYFCSDACKQKFLKAPDKYAASK